MSNEPKNILNGSVFDKLYKKPDTNPKKKKKRKITTIGSHRKWKFNY